MFPTVRFARLVLLFIVSVAAARHAAAAADGVTQANQPQQIVVPPAIQGLVSRMRQTSPTFHAQYERLAAAPRLIVAVRIDPTLTDRSYCARSDIRRYSSGLIVAIVDIGPGARQHEWLAHEFEHVLEQVDGWNLPELARRHGTGVWYAGDALIETERATGAGRAVGREMRAAGHGSDKLVE